MEIEDFEDDTGPPPMPSRARNPTGQGFGPAVGPVGGAERRGPGSTTAPRDGFGIESEVEDVGAGSGLAGGFQRLGLQEAPPQRPGYDSEIRPATTSASGRLGPLGPPGPHVGLQPLSGPGPSRLRPGPSPLRPRAADLPGPSPVQPQSNGFGFDAETAEPGGGNQPLPAPAGSYGLPTIEGRLRGPSGPLQPGLQPAPQPQPQWQRQRSLDQQPDTGVYGLDNDVQAATDAGMLPPVRQTGGNAGGVPTFQQPQPDYRFGLDNDIRDADDARAGTGQPGPTGGLQFGLDAEVAGAGGPGPGPGPPLGPGALQPGVQAFAGQTPAGPGLQGQVQDYPGQYSGYELPGEAEARRWREHQELQRIYADTLSLDQLEAQAQLTEDVWMELPGPQANRTIQELKDRNVSVTIVDIKDAHQKLLDSSAPPRLAYLAAVERAAPEQRLSANCRPSLLQTKLKAGQNRLRKLIDPIMNPGDQGFVDLSFSPDGALQPETGRVWQCGLALVRADGVGKTGLQRVRQPCLFIARMALFDRRANRFLGNVLGLRPEAVSHYDKRWEFNAGEQVIVRCGCVQSCPQAGTRLVTDEALSIFVEFNVSYRLTVEDTQYMPQNEHRSSQLLDEINTCWGMISFKKCLSLTREVEISVPLYHGSIYEPQPMTAFYKEKRSKTPFLSAFKARDSPVLQFRVGPLGAGKPPLMPYAYMPSTMLATHDLATALAAYRMSVALLLARQAGPFAAAADPVLAGFPALLADHHLLAEFRTRWRDLTNKMMAITDNGGCCSPEVLPPLTAMVEAFRRCTIELAPLASCPTIPPRHINNFVEYQGHRLRLVQHYCHVLDPRTHKILGQRNPVEPLSHAGFEFLHAPFDVSEVRVCMADRLEHPEPFYRH